MNLINNKTIRTLVLALPGLLTVSAAQASDASADCDVKIEACEKAAQDCEGDACLNELFSCLDQLDEACHDSMEGEEEGEEELEDEDFGFGEDPELDKAIAACDDGYMSCINSDKEESVCEQEVDSCLDKAFGETDVEDIGDVDAEDFGDFGDTEGEDMGDTEDLEIDDSLEKALIACDDAQNACEKAGTNEAECNEQFDSCMNAAFGASNE